MADDAAPRARSMLGLFNDQGIDRFAERYWDPEIVWTEPDDFPDSGVRRGREACLRRMHERFEFLGNVRLDVVDAWGDDEGMLIEVVVHSRGPTSGARTERREFFLVEFSHGRIVTFREFLDRDQALEAFGA